ncbi:hypothetical protein WA171_003581 [Blastocystis sp. BT1]
MFILFIAFISRNDTSTLGHTSRQTILLLSAFPLSDITMYLTYNTPIVKLLTQNLLDVILQFNSTAAGTTQLDSPEELLRQRLSFLSELLMLCKSSADCKDKPERALLLREALLKALLEDIFQGYFEVELMSIRNSRIVASTRVLRLIITQLLACPASPLIDLIATFICGETTRQPLLFPTLLSRLNNNSNEVSIATMQLFDVLLKAQHPAVLTHLLPKVEAVESVESREFFSIFSSSFSKPLPNHDRLQYGETSLYQQDVEYIAAIAQRCRQAREETPSSSASDSSFLSVLLTRAQMLLRQPMEVNLEVTQLVTTIATIAPLALFETLFIIPESPISFTRELSRVWEKAVNRSNEVLNFNQYLVMTETNLNICDHKNALKREDRLSVDVTFNQFMEGYVVLREFLTELSCVVMMRSSQVFCD